MGRILLIFLAFSFCGTTPALAAESGGLGLDGGLSDMSSFLSPAVVSAVVKTLGVVLNHRAYEPATPLTSWGFDLGVELDLVQVGGELSTAFESAGMPAVAIPFLPNGRMLNLHKGIGDSIDVGGSILQYLGYRIWALDFKYVIFNPEEGVTWAVRVSYNNLYIPIGSQDLDGIATISLSTSISTITPELVVSKKLSFADPYIGVGYQFITGGVNVDISNGLQIPGLSSITATTGSIRSFIGLSLRIPYIFFRTTLQAEYSPDGFNSLGTKIGLAF